MTHQITQCNERQIVSLQTPIKNAQAANMLILCTRLQQNELENLVGADDGNTQ